MESAELSVMVGMVVSFGLQLLKRLWPGLNCTDALVKQVTAVVVAVVGRLALAQWQVNQQTLWQAALAAIAALGTHKALLSTPPAPAGTGPAECPPPEPPADEAKLAA